MKHNIKVWSIHVQNNKQYLVKRYSNGCYYINQVILGKVFYKRWTRTTKDFAMSLMKRFDGSSEKVLQLNYKLK